MAKGSIEFQTSENEDKGSAIRKSYRVPVEERKNYFVIIKDKRYPIVDIGLEGISFFSDSANDFPVGKRVSGLTLRLGKESIADLESKVAHISANSEDQWLCGMIWLNLNADNKKRITSIIQSLKKEVLVASSRKGKR